MGATSRRTLIAGAAASLCSGLAGSRNPFAAIEAGVGGRLGVAAMDLSTGRRIGYRADERFPMCSTFKAMAVAAVLSRADSGQEQLDRFVRYSSADLLSYAPVTRAHIADGGMTLADLCAAAVELSDNTAANLILASIGGPPGWTRFVRSLGDRKSRLDRTELALNSAIPGDARDTTTPNATAADLKATLLDRALSNASRDRLRGWMMAAQTGLARLRAGLPADWQVADKTGTGENGTANDIAVAWTADGPVVITCYLTGASAAAAAARESAIADVARVVADTFSARAVTRHG